MVQLDSSLARRHPGTGLGLSLVSQTAELHGGGEGERGHVDHRARPAPYQLDRVGLLMRGRPPNSATLVRWLRMA